jgi:hypothetical protein
MTELNLPWANVSCWPRAEGEILIMFPRQSLGPITITLHIGRGEYTEFLALMEDYKKRFALPPLPTPDKPPPGISLPNNLDLEF